MVGSCMNTQKTNSKTLEYFVADPNLERCVEKKAKAYGITKIVI
jgi:hypothetical protein